MTETFLGVFGFGSVQTLILFGLVSLVVAVLPLKLEDISVV
jgi:hypothetical protein